MTKGNWERRAERAAIEREEARERKSLRKKPKCPNVETILIHLLDGERYDTSLSNIQVWVEDVMTEWNICRSWFRTGDCNTRRCQLSHEMTLFGIRNVLMPTESSDLATNEPSVDLLSLKTLLPEKYPLVRFISIDDLCVYDWALPNIWLEWSRTRIQDLATRKTLKSINEDPISPPLDEETKEETLSSIDSLPAPSSSSCHLTHLPHSLFSFVCQYCSLSDLSTMTSLSTYFYQLIRKDALVRIRRKESLNSLSKVIQKQKNEEKKKKAKQSYTKKTDKKDAFARGGRG
jgi:hypothetical protein